MHRTIAFLTIFLVGGTAYADAWDDAYDAGAKTRFIPVELWTGAKWDGDRSLKMTKADLTFGSRDHKTIKGPVGWTDPVNGTQYDVYERFNRNKKQLFTVRPDKAGIGRVFDSRGKRVCEPGFKFPLGLWKEGESRSFKVKCWRRGKSFMREMKITILKIDFEFEGVAHSLRYHWIADGGGKEGLDNEYVYSPGYGNVAVEMR